MSNWQSGFVEANGLQIHYTRTGGNRPPLVLSHGVTDSGLCWTPVAQALAADYDVIMVDARGHGHSEAPETGYGPAEQAADLYGVISGLGLQRPAVLGHSMGAITTLALACIYPDAPGMILLEDPPPWWIPAPPDPASSDRPRSGMAAWAAEVKHKTRDELITQQREANPGWSEAELEPWADAKLQFSLNVLSVFEGSTSPNVEWVELLRELTCPALLITGDPASGAAVSADSAAVLQSLLPALRVVHIPGAGHNIRRDRFARYIEVVRSFLDAPPAPSPGL